MSKQGPLFRIFRVRRVDATVRNLIIVGCKRANGKSRRALSNKYRSERPGE